MNYLICFMLVGWMGYASGFILENLCMTEAQISSVRNGDKDLGKVLVAKAIREYYKRNTKLTLQRGSVQKSTTFPNEGISTGHSCSKTAEARNARATSTLIPSAAALDRLDFAPDMGFNIAEGVLRTRVTLNVDVRVRFGYRFFGRCRRAGRKTCSTSGTSDGNNVVSLVMAAPEMAIQRKERDGPEFLVFKPVINVFGGAQPNSWTPISVSGSHCRVIGISINSTVRKYAGRFFATLNRIEQLRSAEIIRELENQLKMKMNEDVWLPICKL